MKQCDKPAVFHYTWAGKDESFCCHNHAAQIQAVAQAMGYYVQFIPLDNNENESCRNQDER